MNPDVSIVIPTYNHGIYLKEAIRSIIIQTFKNWECIIINNLSTDNTVDIVKSFNDPRISIINYKNNGSIAASRNKGILSARSEIIAFLDSDDYWYNIVDINTGDATYNQSNNQWEFEYEYFNNYFIDQESGQIIDDVNIGDLTYNEDTGDWESINLAIYNQTLWFL